MINTTTGGGQEEVKTESYKDEDHKNEEIAALRIMAMNAKNSKFRDRRVEMLENVKRQAHFTRGKVRIKFQDNYTL